MFAAAGKLAGLAEAIHAEALALIKAVSLAEEFGMGRVIFSTDCLPLKQAVVSTSLDRASLGVLFREIKYMLRLGFLETKVEFCPRMCNEPAHKLAVWVRGV